VGNYIEGCRSTGIYMPTAAGRGELGFYGPANYCVVAHNTIVNAGQIGLHIGHPNPHSKSGWRVQLCNNTFIGNLIVSDKGALIRNDGALRSTWRNNIVWATGEAEPGYEHPGIKRVNPGMVKEDGLYRPSNKESAVVDPPSPNFRDVNAPIPGLTTDMDGQKRGSKPDIGADELSSAPVARRPMTPRGVGPTWMRGDPSQIRRIESAKPIPKR
jgi:poly(beta-D-mannuronate) lyase